MWIKSFVGNNSHEAVYLSFSQTVINTMSKIPEAYEKIHTDHQEDQLFGRLLWNDDAVLYDEHDTPNIGKELFDLTEQKVAEALDYISAAIILERDDPYLEAVKIFEDLICEYEIDDDDNPQALSLLKSLRNKYQLAADVKIATSAKIATSSSVDKALEELTANLKKAGADESTLNIITNLRIDIESAYKYPAWASRRLDNCESRIRRLRESETKLCEGKTEQQAKAIDQNIAYAELIVEDLVPAALGVNSSERTNEMCF